MQLFTTKIVQIKTWFLAQSLITKGVLIFLFFGLIWLGIRARSSGTAKTTYQTAKVEKGNLIVALSASGQVSGANSAEVTTQSSGVVSRILVKDGDMVKAGDRIAEIDLDLVGQQRAAQTLSNYQSAQNNVASAKAALYSTQSEMFTRWNTYLNLAQNGTYQNSDGSPNTQNRDAAQFISTNDDWLAAEAKYKNQQQEVAQTQTNLTSAWLSYQQSSPMIVAPISGTITGFSLQVGTVITAQTNSSGGSASQRIASVKTAAPPTISLNLTQIDAPKVKVGNKATIVFDAIADKTFTGEVISVDTIGQTTSSVTTYPAIIKLDSVVEGILPSMTATANIITFTKNDVLLVPASAVQTANGLSTIRIMKNGAPAETQVEIGTTSDTQAEIISGVSEGDTVVTGTTTSTTTRTSANQTSVFSAFGRGGTGGAVRIAR